ncbi:MAG: arylesterase [Pseudomonadota bacterium]
MRIELKLYGVRAQIFKLFAVIVLFVSTPALAADKFVVAFGDSLSAGYGLKPAESFPVQLEAALRRGGTPARVHNAGVSGDTTAQGRARLGFVLRSLKAKPNLVILQLGGNDMLRAIDPAQTEANLSAILADLKKRGIPVLLAGMLAAPNMGKAYQTRFDAVYPKLARQYSVKLYPFFLNGVTANRTLLLKDGIHPTGKGVSVVVAGILPQVKRALGR